MPDKVWNNFYRSLMDEHNYSAGAVPYSIIDLALVSYGVTKQDNHGYIGLFISTNEKKLVEFIMRFT